MMRYLRRLSDRDLALDRTMIPLGSCTMKLNAATEMAPISWREFTDIHPFAPAERSAGYRALIADLESWLAELSGYDAVSVQPNSGAQGEFAGLLAIRRYHESQRGERPRRRAGAGERPRHQCRVGQPRRAARRRRQDRRLTGRSTSTTCAAVLAKHEGTVAGLMITYPSTHGVYEPTVREVCALVHEAGGQVYLDGANLNALVGVSRPGDLGADVSHFNLHKTFCIPHGGGGPGVGPIGVKAHLAPFLPASAVVAGAGPAELAGRRGGGAVGFGRRAADLVGVHPADGRAGSAQPRPRMAVLSANYIAARLREAYPVLYAGPGGLVAHECILDLRAAHRGQRRSPSRTSPSGSSTTASTRRRCRSRSRARSWSSPPSPSRSPSSTGSATRCSGSARRSPPSSAARSRRPTACCGALRTTPTRSPPTSGTAPTRARSLPGRVTPSPAGLRIDKYWPPVGRIDNAYGDRNLVCTCPPVEAYED